MREPFLKSHLKIVQKELQSINLTKQIKSQDL